MVTSRYIVARATQALLTFVAVLGLSFGLIRLMPGGPMDYIRAQMAQNQEATGQQMDRLVEAYAVVEPNKPIYAQFVDYVFSVLSGDLGQSMWYDSTVSSILVDAMPWTIFVSAVALLLMYGIGISLGAIMAYNEGGKLDVSSSVSSIVVTSIPFYVVAIVLLWFLGYQFGLAPTGGRGDAGFSGLSVAFVGSVLLHAALPIASLVIASFGNVALQMRGNSIQILGEDYLRVARLRGLSERRIGLRYVGRNAILPMYTSMMISIGTLFGGSVLLEEIFAYPGVGYYLYKAINARDYPLMMGAFIFMTAGVIIGVFIADLTYGWIDPTAGSASNRETFGKTFSLTGLTDRFRAVGGWFRRAPGRLKRTIRGSDETVTSSELPDGGVYASKQEDNVFNTVSEGSTTRKQRLYFLLDAWIVAPFKILWSDTRAKIGLFIVTLFLLAGTVGVMVIDVPQPGDGGRLVAPFTTLEFVLGTDKLGRGIFALLVHATPPMLKMITAGGVFATTMATLVGVTAGYKGGAVDRVLMAISDIFLTIPGLPLIVVLGALIGPRNPYVVGIFLSINVWAGFARALRSQALSTRNSTYIEASRTLGIPTSIIVLKDMLPKVMPLIMVNFVTAARNVIIASVGLYFLGILPFSTLNWGVMMNMAYKSGGALYDMSAAHWFIAPMATIVLLSLGLLLLGQGMDRIFNPRIRARHASSIQTEESDASAGRTAVADGGTSEQ